MTKRRLRGAALALAAVAGFVAVDLAVDSVIVESAYVLAACVLFALGTRRVYAAAQRSLEQQDVLSAIAELPVPGATLDETIERVVELLVPRVADFAAIDALRGGELERVGSRGERPHDDALVATQLRARGREIGALSVAGGMFRRPGADEFLRALAGRVALGLDNAGLAAELETVEERLRAILANLGEAVTVQDRTGRLVFANQAAAELLGAASVEELLASDTRALMDRFASFHEDGTPLRLDELPGRHVLAGEEAAPLVVRAVKRATGEERWRMTKSTPVLGSDGEVALAVNVIEDITDAKRAELGQRLLAEASKVLGSSLDFESTLERIAALAVPALADYCAVSLPRGDWIVNVAAAHSDHRRVPEAQSYAQARRMRLDGDDHVAQVLRTGRPELLPEITDAMIDAAQLGQEREIVRRLGWRSAMLVPLATPEGTLGVLTMVSAESGRRFGPADLALAEELGRRAGTALENARLHTELREVASTLQYSLLPPRLPDVPGWTFRSLYLPAAGQTDVGGDFYDVFPTAAGWMAVIGDVAGRGPAAASLTTMARYTLRTAGSLVGTPAMGLARLNESLRERPEMAICTAAVVLLREDAEASVVCAGHPLPFLVRGGKAQTVGRSGPLLGAFDHGHWLPASVTFEPGDVLVLYTDGVIDARSRNGGGRFGEERLAETLAGASDPSDAVARIESALQTFAGDEHGDDTAVLALMREG